MKHKKTEPSEYSAAIYKLKRHLKEKQINYADVAEGIGLSESGVKKIFSGSDSSFLRLAQICKFAGISLSEIVEDHHTSEVLFSEKQQEEFLKEPLLFYLYWLLVYERLSLKSAQFELKLTEAEGFRLVRKLDTLSLVKLMPNNRLHVPSIRAVRWIGGGKFLNKLYDEWSYNILKDVSKTSEQPHEIFIIRYLPMTQKTFQEFRMAQKSLEDEFVRRSIYEMQTRHDELNHVRWLVAADNRSFVTARPKRYKLAP